jgi:hypothetical protein
LPARLRRRCPLVTLLCDMFLMRHAKTKSLPPSSRLARGRPVPRRSRIRERSPDRCGKGNGPAAAAHRRRGDGFGRCEVLPCASRISGKGRPSCTTCRRCKNSVARDLVGRPARPVQRIRLNPGGSKHSRRMLGLVGDAAMIIDPLPMKRMIAITIRPGATTAAASARPHARF